MVRFSAVDYGWNTSERGAHPATALCTSVTSVEGWDLNPYISDPQSDALPLSYLPQKFRMTVASIIQDKIFSKERCFKHAMPGTLIGKCKIRTCGRIFFSGCLANNWHRPLAQLARIRLFRLSEKGGETDRRLRNSREGRT